MRKDINRRNKLDEEIDNKKKDSLIKTAGFIVPSLLLAAAVQAPWLYLVISGVKDRDLYEKTIQSYKDDYEEMISDENGVKPIDYANYIVSSDNPDLALHAFCSEFEEDYPKLLDETIKYIEFDYDGTDINNLTYDKYLNINDFRHFNDYRGSVIGEIHDDYKHDREIELDNLNVRVKKLTLDNKEQ